MRPLRRRPKQLGETPLLFEPDGAGSSVAAVATGAGRPDGGTGPVPALPRRQGWVTTTEAGERRVLEQVSESSGEHAAVREMAAAIARRLSVRARRRDRLTTRGFGQLVSAPYRYGSDDID